MELLLVEAESTSDGEVWYCLGTASKGFRAGQQLTFGDGLAAEVVSMSPDGGLRVRLSVQGDALLQALWHRGEIPLPPYIRHASVPAATDPHASRYQTIFARRPGASAAPTAGLHFTQRLLDALDQRGLRRATVTLLVGPGTFLPVRTQAVADHRMHTERYEIPPETVTLAEQAKRDGRRVIPVGTTSLRALEAAAGDGGLRPGPGSTDLFITPGAKFRVADGLMTNFHLPRSTLLMLVTAMVGLERTLAAYRAAVEERYRFFSYGDAMLIL